MQHVANDDDSLASKCLKGGGIGVEMTRKREEIQQRLAGVAVQTITRIEHSCATTGSL